jgi:hypothetical protein
LSPSDFSQTIAELRSLTLKPEARRLRSRLVQVLTDTHPTNMAGDRRAGRAAG